MKTDELIHDLVKDLDVLIKFYESLKFLDPLIVQKIPNLGPGLFYK
ncbi:MAG: hypothetical protein HRT89_02150 [Lentisphaeria bacterium]|nr:hypothetical protein [Lentisphaeria bacterium]NQZ66849.1 hypothetical protein [Lentisphaeria bacterium]